jgi:carbamoyltransferase
LSKILGISAFYHDSAAAIICNGEIIAAAQEERFTRKKHTSEFPIQSIKYCLLESGFSLDELDAVVFYDKPLLKFERLLETYYAFAPKGLFSFLKSMPVWLKDKLFLKKEIYDGLKAVEHYDKKKLKLLFSEHHLSHAASAFYPSQFSEAAILTIDGVGEWATASIGKGEGNKITLLKELHFPHSVGLLYSAFTYYLGFRVNSGEYKLMGLAPYGDPISSQTNEFISTIKNQLVDIKSDGSIWLNQKYFNYSVGLQMTHNEKWANLFGIGVRKEDAELTQDHCNLALAIQTVTEEIVFLLAKEAKRITGSDQLVLAGGVALNCVTNGKLNTSGMFNAIFIQPAAGDAGASLGAALAANYGYFKNERVVDLKKDSMKGSYLGPFYCEKEVMQLNAKYKAVSDKCLSDDELVATCAKLIKDKKIIGWFQGRMEFGPRALGNRSIIALATDAEMQQKINLKIKFREGFRPFAPSVLKEESIRLFELKTESPYMLLVSKIKEEFRNELPHDIYNTPLKERLSVPRSQLSAITHLDYSARIQTVTAESNALYYKLLQYVKKETGFGVLVNTSFNVRGEPLVCSPEDAYRCFMNTEMDVLVLNNYIYHKESQPDWNNKNKWKQTFKRD